MARRRLIIVTLVAGFVTFSRVSTAQTTDLIPFTLDTHGAVIIPVAVDGLGPFRFVLDTGSSASVVSETLAAKIDAPAVAKALITTAAGRVYMPVVRMSHLAIGGTTIEDVLATSMSADALLAAAPGVDGILGQDVLKSHNFTLDYRRRVLRWNDVVVTGKRDARLRLVARDDRVVAECPQDGQRAVLLVPDSGADALVLFGRSKQFPLSVEAVSGAQVLGGIAGQRGVAPAVVHQLRIGPMTLHEQPAVMVSDKDADDGESDGLLPLHHFSSVSFETSGYIVIRQ